MRHCRVAQASFHIFLIKRRKALWFCESPQMNEETKLCRKMRELMVWKETKKYDVNAWTMNISLKEYCDPNSMFTLTKTSSKEITGVLIITPFSRLIQEQCISSHIKVHNSVKMALFASSLETCMVITVAMEKLTATQERRCWLYLDISTCFPFLVDGKFFWRAGGSCKIFQDWAKKKLLFILFNGVLSSNSCLCSSKKVIGHTNCLVRCCTVHLHSFQSTNHMHNVASTKVRENENSIIVSRPHGIPNGSKEDILENVRILDPVDFNCM